MKLRRAVATSILSLFLTACASQQDAAGSDSTRVGTVTTEGAVTIVVNESGSVWDGSARLVEEASIGVDESPRYPPRVVSLAKLCSHTAGVAMTERYG